MKRSLVVLLPSVLPTGCMHMRVETTGLATPRVGDPPGRVARLSYLRGAVSFKAAGTDEWVPAVLNRSLTTGDELWTDQDARAELDLGHAFARLDHRTNIGLLNLDDRGVQIKVSEGTAQVRLRRLDEEDEFELDTPQAAISLLRTGDYRVVVKPTGAETDLTVRSGQAEVTTPALAFIARSGQQMRMIGTTAVTNEIVAAPASDQFDGFCKTRDRRSERAESLQYVSPYVIGWEDLDEFGYWRVHAIYGRLWTPRAVAAGWAPYSTGHWVWVEPWGWTWVDDAPWGFAPFHYGRWVVLDGIWVWVPGPVHIRAVYAPALVVFIGGGPGLHYFFRVGVELGVAWFPLGPREVYVPPYRCSRVYVTNVNISHTVVDGRRELWKTDMTRQHYANRTIRGAVTAVPEDVFTGSRRITRSALEVGPRDTYAAHIGGSAPPVAPTRRSVSLEPDSNRPAPRPPETTARRPVTVRRTPAQLPDLLERRRETLERDPGRPPDPSATVPGHRPESRPAPEYRPVRSPTPPARKTGPPPVPKAKPQRPQQTAPTGTERRRKSIEQERRQTKGGRTGRGV